MMGVIKMWLSVSWMEREGTWFVLPPRKLEETKPGMLLLDKSPISLLALLARKHAEKSSC